MASHETVIQWFEDLVPEINQSQDPKQVLTKFARKNNLAPAQLEKLGHIYNSAKTLSFFDNNTQRYQSFNILDVPEMLENYEEPTLDKAAEQFSKSANSNQNVEFQECTQFPNLMGEPDIFESTTDLSNEIDEQFKKIASVREVHTKSSYAKLNKEAAEQYAFELGKNVRDAVNEVAISIKKSGEKKAHLEEVLDDLNLELDGGFKHFVHDYLIPTLDDSYHIKVGSRDFGNSKSGLTNTKDKEMKQTVKQAYYDYNALFAAKEVAQEYGGEIKQAFFNTQTNHNNILKSVFDTSAENKIHQKYAAMQKAKNHPDDGNKSLGKSKGDKKNSDKDKLKTILQAPSRALAQYKGINEALTDSLPTKNKNQQKYDEDMLELKHQTVIDTLFQNDPVLSNLTDEEKEIAIAAFNSIKNIAPTVAMDISAVRPWLRQANEYGGITPNELSTILSLEQSIQSVQMGKSRVDDINYSVS